MVSLVYRSSTPTLIAVVSQSCCINCCMPFARPLASSTGTKIPSCSRTMSLGPPQRVATTGLPDANDSSRTMPNVSYRLGCTKASIFSKNVCASPRGMEPVNVTRLLMSNSLHKFSNRSLSGPDPPSKSLQFGTLAKACRRVCALYLQDLPVAECEFIILRWILQREIMQINHVRNGREFRCWNLQNSLQILGKRELTEIIDLQIRVLVSRSCALVDNNSSGEYTCASGDNVRDVFSFRYRERGLRPTSYTLHE